jgi:ribonucleoside-diphosphate reductase alpha chain
VAQIPDAILHSNDRDVYGAFVRGLFEADGGTYSGYASWSTVSESFSRDVQTLLLTLGFVTTRKVDGTDSNWGTHRLVLALGEEADLVEESLGRRDVQEPQNESLVRSRDGHVVVARRLTVLAGLQRPGPGPGMRPVRRHGAAHRQLLHVLELRQ